MPLRVMQIFVPEGSDQRSQEMLEGREVLGQWQDTYKGHSVLHLLVPAEDTEPIMDQFEQLFAEVEGFHVVLFPVEAVLPRPQVDPDEKERGEQGKGAVEANGESGSATPRISREELYNEVCESVGVSRVFVGMTILSAMVAAVGLMRDDVAVIIGAMVIAPLLGPNVAMALATTLGDTGLLRQALFTNVVGVACAFVFAVLAGAVCDVSPSIPAISSRTDVGAGDILLALAAGAAGTLAFTRGLSGAVIGVMVAVALVPPLVVAGLLLGSGERTLAFGALLLTGANVICINLAGIATFLVQGVRPRGWSEVERAKSSTLAASVIWTIMFALLLLILWLNSR